MSLLVIKLPPRERLGARAAGNEAAPSLRLPTQWEYVLSADGLQPGPLRQAATALLPKAAAVVLALAPSDVSWHRLLVPKAAPARMPAALAGMLEERLLDDEDAVHLALAPDAVPGREGWVAATHRPRLAAALAALESAGLTVERVVSQMPPPGPGWRGHFVLQGPAAAAARAAFDASADRTDDVESGAAAAAAAQANDGEPLLWLSRDDGAWCLPLAATTLSGLAGAMRGALPEVAAGQRWTTTPAAALAAERYLGRPVALQTEAEHLLEAAQGDLKSAVNLRQFDLAARHRGLRAVGALGKRFFSAEWRLARIGLAALLALQLLGLNAYAWQQRQVLQSRQAAINEVLRTTHPQVQTVLDAPAQMAGETERLRAAAGRPGGADLEVALSAAAAAWPDGKGPVGQVRYEAGRLTLAAAGWTAADVTAMQVRLRPAGWTVELAEGRLTLARARLPGATP